jgi:seryl-tRNA synthetase
MDIGLTLTAFGAMIAGFYGIARLMLSQASKDRDADRNERELLAKSIIKMAKASEKVATATERSANEAKQRNGHLGEQNMKIAELVSQGNELTKEIVTTLHDSATTLARDTHDVAVAVKTVKADLIDKRLGKD